MNARLAAVYALYDVIVERKSLSSTLNDQLSKLTKVSDKGLCQEIVYGTLRYYPSLQKTLNAFLNKSIPDKNKPLEITLCTAIYQLYQLKQPHYAVINESVGLVAIDFEWAKGFVNGVLRNIVRLNNRVLKTDKYHDHPKWLAKKIQQTYPQQAESIFHENHHAAKVMLLVRHMSREDYLAKLHEREIDAYPHIDNKDAIILNQSIKVTTLPLFSEGFVTVQDANAQLAANLLGVRSGMHILDACAAPGGKTAHIADKANDITLTAIDKSAERTKLLENTLARLRVSAKIITADMLEVDSWHDGKLFDCILLDAPCSATGVIRKHPDILFHRRQSDIATLVNIQSQLLDVCWTLLKPKGRLLYATCSILPEENTGQIQAFLSRTSNALVKPLGHNRSIVKQSGFLQFLPDEMGDGFFYAALEKHS